MPLTDGPAYDMPTLCTLSGIPNMPRTHSVCSYSALEDSKQLSQKIEYSPSSGCLQQIPPRIRACCFLSQIIRFRFLSSTLTSQDGCLSRSVTWVCFLRCSMAHALRGDFPRGCPGGTDSRSIPWLVSTASLMLLLLAFANIMLDLRPEGLVLR